jgi:diguanylate cyclase (GGDEF)-like protein/PAS domain S-box-containing protein
MHGMLRNVTIRKRIDEELQKNRSDLQTVLNSIPTSIFYTDRNHRFTQVNQAFCKSLGFPMEQVLGKTLSELFPRLPAAQLAHFYTANEEVISSGKSQRGIVEIFPSIRGRRWIQNDRVAYHDEKGKIEGVMCLAIDISDLRETEEKLWYLSFHDALTGVYNRAYFDEEMVRLENSRQFPVSIIVVHVDDLINVNNRLGIAAGNELLRRTGEVMKATRSEDVAARISGDRFAVLLPLADMSIGENTVARLKESLNFHNKHYSGAPLNLSFGVATGEKGEKLPEVLNKAEEKI